MSGNGSIPLIIMTIQYLTWLSSLVFSPNGQQEALRWVTRSCPPPVRTWKGPPAACGVPLLQSATHKINITLGTENTQTHTHTIQPSPLNILSSSPSLLLWHIPLQVLDIIAIFREVQFHKAIFSKAITAAVKWFSILWFLFCAIWPHLSTAHSLLKLSPLKSWCPALSLFLVSSNLLLELTFLSAPVIRPAPCLQFSLNIPLHLPLCSPVVSLVVPPGCVASCTLPPSSPGTAPGARWCSHRLLLGFDLLCLYSWGSSPQLLRSWSDFHLWIEIFSLKVSRVSSL